MPAYGPLGRTRFIKALRDPGFSGAHTGTGKHPQFMRRGDIELQPPNEHRRDIGRGLLGELLKQAGVTRKEWEHV